MSQTGKRNAKHYRIVAIEKRERRDGRPVEILGYFDPTVKPPHVKLEKDRIAYWVSKGAVITDSVKKLLEQK
jgi:small subunit ribosomal protein S16